MSMNLYEILDLDRNASPEEIRRAYRQKALKTHPDKMPVGTSQEEKITAEEEFRQITHAYEILSDLEARRQYDRGSLRSSTMPQETPRGQRGPRQYNTFDPSMFDGFGGFDNDPFFSSAFGRGFQFRDPRELFNSLFADMERQFGDDPVFSSAFGRSPFGSRSSFPSRPGGPFDSFGQSALTPFGQSSLIPFGSGFPLGGSSMFPGPMFPDMNTGSTSRMSSFSNFSQTAGSNDRWVSQSKTTNNINGRTETIIKKRDAEGNEHITYITPEGERTTINGVEQPRKDQRTIQSGPPPPPSRSQTRPPPPVTNPPPPPPQNYYSPPPQSQPVYNTQNPYATDPTSYAVNQAPYVAPPPAHTNQPAPTYPPPQPPKNSFADTYNLNRTSKTVDHSKPPSPIRERTESYKRHRSSGEETVQIRDRDRRDSKDRGKDEDDRTRRRDLEREREKEKEREKAKDRERHHHSHTHDKHTQPPSQSPTQEDGDHHHKNRWPGWLGRVGKLFKRSVDRHEAAH